MKSFGAQEVVRATGGKLVRAGKSSFTGVSVDSRSIGSGDLFFAIKGERFDGHRFVQAAIDRGAAGVVVSERGAVRDEVVVVRVGDTRKALLDLAGYYRGGLATRVVAVTGSNGKTTTKDMIAAILGTRSRVVRALGSFNNDIGVPLTVFRLEPDTEFGVFEIEMNVLGGTKRLASVCRPSVGVVTNIGDTHLESMRSRNGVAREKAELLEALPEDGVAVLNADDPKVMGIGRKYCRSKVVTFGVKYPAQVFATDVRDLGLEGMSFRIQGRYEVRIPLPGIHHLANCLAACAAANALGIEFASMGSGLESYRPSPGRLEVKRLGAVVLIDDSYNANPQSVRAAIDTLCRNADRSKRVAFLGDMLELGGHSIEAHTEVGRLVAGCVDRVVFAGPLGEHAASVAIMAGMAAGKVRVGRDSSQVLDYVVDMVRAGDTILVKGSRAMRMELVADAITKKYGQEPDQVH